MNNYVYTKKNYKIKEICVRLKIIDHKIVQFEQ